MPDALAQIAACAQVVKSPRSTTPGLGKKRGAAPKCFADRASLKCRTRSWVRRGK